MKGSAIPAAPRANVLFLAVLGAALIVACAGASDASPTVTTAPATATDTQAAARVSPAVPATLTAGSTPAGGAPTGVDPAVRCYIEAVNAANLDALVACFAPDATIIDVNRRIVGSDAIRTWARNEVIGGSLQIFEHQPRPSGARLLVHWAPRGATGWRAWYTFEIRDGRIALADLQYA